MWPTEFKPKFWTVVLRARHYTGTAYSRESFFKDLTAGLVVGVVALPLAIAFGIASGVKPEQGLFTAIIAGFLISLLSGSRVQIGGPTGAFIVIIYGVVSKFGYDGLAVATMMAGVFLVIMGFTRMGDIIKYIPRPVTVGFTSGIALIILSGQVADFLGLPIRNAPADFIHKWEAYAEVIDKFDPMTALVGAATVAVVIFWPRVSGRVPGAFVAVILTTAAVKIFELPLETIGSRFGTVSAGLPMPTFPTVTVAKVKQLVSPAVSIALLAGIESLLSAVVADGMTGKRHRSNMELISQGVANIASPLFGGIPATGAIARTATNVRNGGNTPVAGIVHAVVLLLILIFFAKWAALIPLATLAGILVVVAYHMSEWQMFVKMLRSPKSDITVLIITFLLTVLVDLTVAIQVGVVLAAILFMRRMAEVTEADYMKSGESDEDERQGAGPVIPKDVIVYKINGPFFFGAAEKLKTTLSQMRIRPRAIIINMRQVPAMDSTGIYNLEEFHRRTAKEGTALIFAGLQDQPARVMENSGLLDLIGRESVRKNLKDALDYAETVRPVKKSRKS